MTRAGLLCLIIHLIRGLILPGSLGKKQCTRHLGSIVLKNWETPFPLPPTLWKLKETDLLGQTRLSLAHFFMLRVFASYVGSSCSFCRGQIHLFPHLTPPHRDLGHLHSKWQCPSYAPNRDQTLCFTKIHLWPRKVENQTSDLDVTCEQSLYWHLCVISRLCRSSSTGFHY